MTKGSTLNTDLDESKNKIVYMLKLKTKEDVKTEPHTKRKGKVSKALLSSNDVEERDLMEVAKNQVEQYRLVGLDVITD